MYLESGRLFRYGEYTTGFTIVGLGFSSLQGEVFLLLAFRTSLDATRRHIHFLCKYSGGCVKLTTQFPLVQRLRSRGVVPSLLRPSVLILILMYLLTTIGLTPGGSSTLHVYTQTIQRTTQLYRIPRTEHI